MSIIDDVTRGIGNAVTDVRHKVVEEPYFGRVVTDGPEAPTYSASTADQDRATDAPPEATEARPQPQAQPTPEQPQERSAPDLDFDR